MDALALQNRIRALVEPTTTQLGYDLVAVQWNGRILRVSIDAPGGVDADDCARVSEQISPLLDAEDPIPSAYTLEVSSPGIDRPIQRAQDFERFKGYRCKLKLVEGPPRRRYTGVIGPLDGDELLLSVDGAEHRIALDLVESAQLVLTLSEFEKLGPDAS